MLFCCSAMVNTEPKKYPRPSKYVDSVSLTQAQKTENYGPGHQLSV